uniref:Uncharacterized protein n=1 Tax=Solanum tuberosum TaxID=4113 RepID=M1DEQ3_SOLTU
MAMTAKQSQTSPQFPVLISDLCRQRIEVKYMKDEFERRRVEPLDTSPVVNIENMKTYTTPPIMASEMIDASEADEKDLVTREEAVYKELKDLKGDLVQLATEASLRDISMIGPIGS